ncbi:MAG: acyl-CoA synthetase FdrA [Nitrososphaeria archaeon]
MPVKCLVKKNEYRDSTFLMRIRDHVKALEGINEAAVLMATESNKQLVKDIGLLSKEMNSASSNDLLIVVKGTEGAIKRAFRIIEDLLTQKESLFAEKHYRTLDSALSDLPDANLAVISIPGQFASREVRKALNRNLNVFLFSDNVPIEDELQLKLLAKEKNLLLMGPGCGTAIINNVGLGFSNSVNKGKIGVVASSGTGIQEFSVLVHRLNSGISHAIGVGSRDLSSAIGGLMTKYGLNLLENDGSTKVIVLISKQSSEDVLKDVVRYVRRFKKPVIVDFIGDDSSWVIEYGIVSASTLEDAAIKAVALERGISERGVRLPFKVDTMKSIVGAEISKLSNRQKFVRGLFSGGALCRESLSVLSRYLGHVYSNVPLSKELKLADSRFSKGHTCVDLGEEEFTAGKAHPMIDFDIRCRRILQESMDERVAVILFDIILGYGCNMNPASVLIPIIKQAKSNALKRGQSISFVASICGTEKDPQNIVEQERRLNEVGVVLTYSNAQASKLAALIASKGTFNEVFREYGA